MQFQTLIKKGTLVGIAIGTLSLIIVACEKDLPPESPEVNIYYIDLEIIPGLNIQVISPLDGSSVSWSNTIKGRAKGIPTGYWLRVLIRPETGSEWWPQELPIFHSDSTWSAAAYIGLKNEDVGKKFDIGAIVVTEQQRQKIDADFKSGNTRFRIDGPIPAIITVTRI